LAELLIITAFEEAGTADVFQLEIFCQSLFAEPVQVAV
jgi:hypothetical protein